MRNPFGHWDFVTWFFAIVVVMFAVGGIAEGIDWIDKRSCRTHGGQVDKLDGGEWRCVGARPGAQYQLDAAIRGVPAVGG